MESAVPTTSVKGRVSHPLQHLDYFMEWGAKPWRHLMDYAFRHFLGTDLQGQRVLEVGTRYGKMTCLFALLGGKVIGLDLSNQALSVAQKEAGKWNISENVMFVQGGSELSLLKDGSFDVVFSKSVLVVVADLARFLKEINGKLKPGGKVVFLENAKGPWFVDILRRFRHGKWDYTKARYFTPQEINVVSDIFTEVVVKQCAFPPVVLMLGRKRS